MKDTKYIISTLDAAGDITDSIEISGVTPERNSVLLETIIHHMSHHRLPPLQASDRRMPPDFFPHKEHVELSIIRAVCYSYEWAFRSFLN